MKAQELFESLKDMPVDKKLFHHTNIKALYGILKTGSLKGSHYPINTRGDDKPEIATMRQAVKTDPKKYDELSGEIGSVEFILYPERISASVRGVKKPTPIAELPQNTKLFIKNTFLKGIKDATEKEADKFVKHLENNLTKYTRKGKESFIKRFSSEYEGRIIKHPVKNDAIYSIATGFGELWRNLKNRREGEERIAAKSIPLNKELMKISIKPGFKKDWTIYPGKTFMWRKQEVEEFISLIKKNISLFDNNSVLKSLIETLEKIKDANSVIKTIEIIGNIDKKDKEEILFYNTLKN